VKRPVLAQARLEKTPSTGFEGALSYGSVRRFETTEANESRMLEYMEKVCPLFKRALHLKALSSVFGEHFFATARTISATRAPGPSMYASVLAKCIKELLKSQTLLPFHYETNGTTLYTKLHLTTLHYKELEAVIKRAQVEAQAKQPQAAGALSEQELDDLHRALQELAGQMRPRKTQVPMDKYSMPAGINAHADSFLATKEEVARKKARGKKKGGEDTDSELEADEYREGPGEGEEDSDEAAAPANQADDADDEAE
jgi:hypothetical protein